MFLKLYRTSSNKLDIGYCPSVSVWVTHTNITCDQNKTPDRRLIRTCLDSYHFVDPLRGTRAVDSVNEIKRSCVHITWAIQRDYTLFDGFSGWCHPPKKKKKWLLYKSSILAEGTALPAQTGVQVCCGESICARI